jgi:dihydrofolate synthase / folylpolyglutamate synthase
LILVLLSKTFLQGTTCFKLCEVLKANGYRTGLFVSPHLASFRERMQVNSELVSESSFVAYLRKILNWSSEHDVPLSEFEVAFCMAAMHFKESNCDVVVLEVLHNCFFCP